MANLKADDLRETAEKMLQMRIYDLQDQEPSNKDIHSLIHELQVHQIELEMAIEELRKSQEEAEVARNRYVDLYDFAPVCYFTFNNKGNFLINIPFSLYRYR